MNQSQSADSLVRSLRVAVQKGDFRQRSAIVLALRQLEGEGVRAIEREVSRTTDPGVRDDLNSVLAELH